MEGTIPTLISLPAPFVAVTTRVELELESSQNGYDSEARFHSITQRALGVSPVTMTIRLRSNLATRSSSASNRADVTSTNHGRGVAALSAPLAAQRAHRRALLHHRRIDLQSLEEPSFRVALAAQHSD